MFKRSVIVAALLTLGFAPSAYAQKVEVSGIFGWTLSDGVTGQGVLAGDGNVYNAVDVKDSASWGFAVGVNATSSLRGTAIEPRVAAYVACGLTSRGTIMLKQSLPPYM